MPTSPAATDFLVHKTDPAKIRFAEVDLAELKPGEARLEIDRFAFTANNITYAMLGDDMGYWRFFPAPEGWGQVPAWGYGDVVASRAEGIEVGQRFYGYFPMSTHLDVEPMLTAAGFGDSAAHRAEMPSIYNSYIAPAANPLYAPELEDHEMLLRPLFSTAFVLSDHLAENDFSGARQVVFSSASSKTALGTAARLARYVERPRLVALTSTKNVAFVHAQEVYDQVLSYETLSTLETAEPTLFVDFAGNHNLARGVHEHFGERLTKSLIIGITHWHGASQDPLPGTPAEPFFAPTQIEKRIADWGIEGFQQRFGATWKQLIDFSRRWMCIERRQGAEAVERAYLDALAGRTKPDVGLILSL